MKEAFTDLKSFITVSIIFLIILIVCANFFGITIDDKLFTMVNSLVSSIFGYYFAKINSNSASKNEETDVDTQNNTENQITDDNNETL